MFHLHRPLKLRLPLLAYTATLLVQLLTFNLLYLPFQQHCSLVVVHAVSADLRPPTRTKSSQASKKGNKSFSSTAGSNLNENFKKSSDPEVSDSDSNSDSEADTS